MSRFTMFGAASLDCNHLEGLQKAKKLETLYGFGSHLSELKKFIWATFDRSWQLDNET